jgi:NAD(P)-dependent dehydrogenase (short-subunit alcohol dehydrogenase family)
MNAFFQSKRFIITGAASGIGLATARLLHQAGARLALWDRAASVEAAAAGLGGLALVVDVTDPAAVAAAMTRSVEHLGGLDGLIHCAGVLHAGEFTAVPLEAHQRTVSINLGGSLNTAYAALPHLRRSRGSLCLIASVSAFAGSPEYSVYGATKAAVLGFGQALRLEEGRTGVHIGIVCPLFVRTPMIDGYNGATHLIRSRSPFFETRLPEQVAPSILAGIQARRFLITVGWRAKLLYLMTRYLAWAVHPITRLTYRQGGGQV